MIVGKLSLDGPTAGLEHALLISPESRPRPIVRAGAVDTY